MGAERGPWIVAGMHRSGTSLLASVLTASGIDMGERLLAGDERNRPGYFEDLDFLDLDRRMLSAACPQGDGGHPDWGWTETERLDSSVFEAYRERGKALVADRAGRGRAWGFKDPRAALLLDFWLSLAPGARFLLPYRMPWAVADSMQRLGADVFLRRPDYGYRIWAFYNRRLLDFHRRHPDRTLLLSMEAAVGDPDRFARVMREAAGLAVGPEHLAGRFDPRLLACWQRDDPLVPLAVAAHPDCAALLAALDEAAPLPAAGLWTRDAPQARRLEGDPRVAVVVPCFEDGEFLIEAVASVERVVDVPRELIVVDDGSQQPRTRAILDLLEQAGYDVHRRPHRGVAAARNHGFAVTRAPCVIPLDADNRLLPVFVEGALAVLDEHPRVAAVYGDRVEFGFRSGRVQAGVFDLHRIVCENYVDTCAAIRRQAWEECGGYDEDMPLQGWEDWDLWLALVERGWAMHRLADPGFEYRVRPGSMLGVLEASPELPRVLAYVIGKHHALYLGSARSMLAGLRAARTELDAARAAFARDGRSLHALVETWRARASAAEDRPAVRAYRRLEAWQGRVSGRRAAAAEPCVIGATGGSGTRVFARLVEEGGLWLGGERNAFEDALPIERFLDRWVVPFWEGGGAEPPHACPPGMDEALAAALAEQFAGAGDASAPRGWKSPRSLYLLPFLAQRFPGLRFLHVVRDGRDMALSANQLQLARYGALLLAPEQQSWAEAERSMALWVRVNGWAADVGARLGAAYLRVRWEDLCARPAAVTARVFRFFGLPGDRRRAARLVETPPSLGRGRRADPLLGSRLEEIGGAALKRFGYLPGGEQGGA